MFLENLVANINKERGDVNGLVFETIVPRINLSGYLEGCHPQFGPFIAYGIKLAKSPSICY